MASHDVLWSWLIRAAVLNALILVVGGLVVSRLREPVDRLRLIQWVLAGCLIAPWLPVVPAWRTVSMNLIRSSSMTEVAVSTSDRPTAELSATEIPTAVQTSPPVTATSIPATTLHEPGLSMRKSPERIVAEPSATLVRISSETNRRRNALKLRNAVIALYLASSLAMLIRGLAALWRRQLLQQRAQPAAGKLLHTFHEIAGPAGLHVRLLVSDDIDSPMTWGTLRSVIVIPCTFVDQSSDVELRWGLAHEWSHVQRRDIASLWLAWAAQFICFYQPLYWMLRRRMILCQDYLADAFAARHADTTEDYAAFLVRLAKSRLQPTVPLALGIIERKSQLSERVKMLIDPHMEVSSTCRRSVTLLAACGSLAFLLLLTTIRLDASGEPKTFGTATQPVAGANTETSPAGPAVPSSAIPIAIAAESPPELPLEVGVVSGTLIDAAEGKPVAGAKVLLRSGGLKTTMSDDTGRFRFEKVPAYANGYELWAYRENLITEKVQLIQSTNENTTVVRFKPQRLEMKPGKQARFLVTSKATGKPLANAAVRFGYPDRRNVLTSEEGGVMVGGLLPQKYEVVVEAEGYARNVQQLDLSQDIGVAEFGVLLALGGEVQGVVVDEQGAPVPGASVGFREPNGVGFWGDSPRTDDEGKFRHRFLPLDVPLEVSVNKDDYVRLQQDVSVSSNQRQREIRVTMARRPPGGSVAGIVRDQSGNPVVNAQVANYGNGSSQERVTVTDNTGRFLLHDLIDGFTGVEVYVSAKGFSPQRLPVKPGTADAPAEMAVILEPGHTIRGRVMNEAGAPVGGAYVMARSGVYQPGLTYVRADDQGAFAFDSLPSDVLFQFSHSKFASTQNMPLALDSAEPVIITLDDPGLIRGQVIDTTTQQPIRQFRIRLGFSRVHQANDAKGSYDGTWGNPGLTFNTDDGRFTIQPLTDRMPLELIIEAEGHERLILPRVVAAKAKSAEEISIPLTPMVAKVPYSLMVQLRDDSAKPIPNAQLRLIVSTNQPSGPDDNAFNWALMDSGQLGQKSYVEQFLPGVTNAEGKCEFRNIVPGRYLQLAYWGEGVPKGRSLAFDETRPGQSDNVVIDLPRPAIVRGTVDRTKFPNAGAVRISGPGRGFLEFKTELADGQSQFELKDLPPGSYWIAVSGKPVRFTENGHGMSRISSLVSQRIVLKPGDTQEIHFETPDPPR